MKRSAAYQHVAGFFPCRSAFIKQHDVRAHIPCDAYHTVAGGIDPDIADQDLGTRDDGSCHEKIGRGGDVSGDCDRPCAELGGLADSRLKTAFIERLRMDRGTESAQHPFCVISGESGLDHGRRALGIQTCHENRRFDLGGCHGTPIGDAVELCAVDSQRGTVIAGQTPDPGPHFRERL